MEAIQAKSDALDDVDATKGSRVIREKTKVEEARLYGSRTRLAQASADLASIFVARFGIARQPNTGIIIRYPQADTVEADNKLRKRKLPAPRDGWKDAKGVTISDFSDR